MMSSIVDMAYYRKRRDLVRRAKECPLEQHYAIAFEAAMLETRRLNNLANHLATTPKKP